MPRWTGPVTCFARSSTGCAVSPQARGTKAKYRIDAFYELEKKAKQQHEAGNVNLDVKASYIGSKIFEAEHVSKRFGDLKIVEDFNYIFARYEKMGIVGNNGTGKSTFIKMLMGKWSLTAVVLT